MRMPIGCGFASHGQPQLAPHCCHWQSGPLPRAQLICAVTFGPVKAAIANRSGLWKRRRRQQVSWASVRIQGQWSTVRGGIYHHHQTVKINVRPHDCQPSGAGNTNNNSSNPLPCLHKTFHTHKHAVCHASQSQVAVATAALTTAGMPLNTTTTADHPSGLLT